MLVNLGDDTFSADAPADLPVLVPAPTMVGKASYLEAELAIDNADADGSSPGGGGAAPGDPSGLELRLVRPVLLVAGPTVVGRPCPGLLPAGNLLHCPG